jgi:hypothetical protein
VAYDVPQLMRMPQSALDALFSDSTPGEVPDGDARGTAIVAPGTVCTPELAELIGLFGWQGKSFDARRRVLRHAILPFGLSAIIARIGRTASWLDGKGCITLDYAETSLVPQRLRDEIRAIGPNLYLGKAYWGKERLLDFALEF